MALEFVLIPRGTYELGSFNFYSEEAPVYRATVNDFYIASTPLTNSEFAKFVNDTGYITTAEQPPDEGESTKPGSLVFTPSSGPVDLRDWRNWWRWQEGASWKSPKGPGSSIEDLQNHPVTHVSFIDALAYCEWSQTRLPTEQEWEIASRGKLDQQNFSWGNIDQNPAELLANTWQGSFPWKNDGALGWKGTSPVGIFPPNGYGLFDMTGNVWEWTSSAWTTNHEAKQEEMAKPCTCGCSPTKPGEAITVKGGSHLCSIDYCFRYRPAARSSQATDASTSHLGFRVVKNQ